MLSQQLGTPLQAGHHPGGILLWDSMPFPNPVLLKVDQCGCVGHSSICSMTKMILQVSNRFEGWTRVCSFHPLNSQTLEALWWSWLCGEDRCHSGGSKITEMWDHHWLQNLILICLSTTRCPSGAGHKSVTGIHLAALNHKLVNTNKNINYLAQKHGPYKLFLAVKVANKPFRLCIMQLWWCY